MIDCAEAKRRVEQILATRGVGGADGIAIQETIERPYGWAFLYNSKRYLETGDLADCLFGAGPVIVLSATGEVYETGSTRPPLEEVALLERRLRLTP